MSIRKEISNRIQGIAILMMIVHHLFAFPDRLMFDYISVWGVLKHLLAQCAKYVFQYLHFFLGTAGTSGKLQVSM